MSIRLETAQRAGIDNNQFSDRIEVNEKWNEKFRRDHSTAEIRTKASGMYNCHGLTFACRRTRIEDGTLLKIVLEHDAYSNVAPEQVMPGDVIVYYSDDGDANHSGIVVEVVENPRQTRICSKWGNAGEFLHLAADCPQSYGPHHRYFRCHLR